MFRKKPKKSRLMPLLVTSTFMFIIAFNWGLVIEAVARGVML